MLSGKARGNVMSKCSQALEKMEIHCIVFMLSLGSQVQIGFQRLLHSLLCATVICSEASNSRKVFPYSAQNLSYLNTHQDLEASHITHL